MTMVDTRGWSDPQPSNPIWPPQEWQGWQQGGCSCGGSGCGGWFKGPGHGVCMWCLREWLTQEIICILKTNEEVQQILQQQSKMGVTDGTPPVPGEIGEVIAQNFVGTIDSTGIAIIGGFVVPPGDWDVAIECTFNIALAGADLEVPGTAPEGMIGNLFTSIFLQPPAGSSLFQNLTLVSARTAAIFKVPTLIPVQIHTGAAGVGAGYDLTIGVRRMR